MSKLILYVDDEYPNRILFQLTFRGELEILLASSALEALEILKDNDQIDLVISDMKMPIMDGLTFIVKAKPLFPEVKFCLLTGYQQSEEMQKLSADGTLSGFFNKPFLKHEILDFVNSMD